MEEKKVEKSKTRLERLLDVRRVIAEIVNEEIRKSTRDREYGIAKMTRSPYGPKSNEIMVPYTEDTVVGSGETFSFAFGVEHDVPGSGIEGLPETVERYFGVESPFALRHLLVCDEDAPHFVVEGVFVGQGRAVFFVPKGIPAIRFTENVAKRPTFERGNISTSSPVIVVARNVSSSPCVFRARVIGKEVFVSGVPEPEVFPDEAAEETVA